MISVRNFHPVYGGRLYRVSIADGGHVLGVWRKLAPRNVPLGNGRRPRLGKGETALEMSGPTARAVIAEARRLQRAE